MVASSYLNTMENISRLTIPTEIQAERNASIEMHKLVAPDFASAGASPTNKLSTSEDETRNQLTA